MSHMIVHSRGRHLNEKTGFWHYFCKIIYFNMGSPTKSFKFLSKEKFSSFEEISEFSRAREEKRRKRLWEAARNAHG